MTDEIHVWTAKYDNKIYQKDNDSLVMLNTITFKKAQEEDGTIFMTLDPKKKIIKYSISRKIDYVTISKAAPTIVNKPLNTPRRLWVIKVSRRHTRSTYFMSKWLPIELGYDLNVINIWSYLEINDSKKL